MYPENSRREHVGSVVERRDFGAHFEGSQGVDMDRWRGKMECVAFLTQWEALWPVGWVKNCANMSDEPQRLNTTIPITCGSHINVLFRGDSGFPRHV